jgi:hypothetical protein
MMSEPQGLVRPEGLGGQIKFGYFIAFRTRDLPVCYITSQSQRYCVTQAIFQGLYNLCNSRDLVGFEVFTALTMENGVFWDVTPCGYCKNRRFGGT